MKGKKLNKKAPGFSSYWSRISTGGLIGNMFLIRDFPRKKIHLFCDFSAAAREIFFDPFTQQRQYLRVRPHRNLILWLR